jgi:hypothetical protein
MKKSTVYIIFAAVAILAVIVLLSTTSTDKIDVIGKTSITSFKEILNTIQDRVSVDEMNGGWALTAPDESAKFIWSRDYSKSPLHDVMLEFSAQPFISAGLDLERLPDGLAFEGKIMVGTKLGNDVPSYDGEITPLSSYEQIVKLNRDSIKYHAALDHYGVSLADGNMFEWAKDMSKNDKDIVFVLNPERYLSMPGLTPQK